MNGREQVVAYAALYQPDVIAGFRIDDLVDVPTLGGCEVYRVDSAAVAHVENFNRGRSEMRLENSVEGRMILDSWTVRTVVLIPSVRARASSLIRERVQTLQPSPGRLGEIHTPALAEDCRKYQSGVEPMRTPAEQLKPRPTILQETADRNLFGATFQGIRGRRGEPS